MLTNLHPLTREKFREILGGRRSGCHAILRDNEGLQPQEAVEAMIKFLFAKWYDEQTSLDLLKRGKQNQAYSFWVTPKTDPQQLVTQVAHSFEQAKAWERDTLKQKFGPDFKSRLTFTDRDVLRFKPHTTVEIVRRLQPWSLQQTSVDIKGAVFEDFLGKIYRGDLGQYFTPTPIIKLMVGLLQPTIHDFVGDPACGSGRMLSHVLDYVREQKHHPRLVPTPPPSHPHAERGDETEGQAFIEFKNKHLFGAEISGQVLRLARLNSLLHGAPAIDLQLRDSLAPLSDKAGLPQQAGFYQNGLTMILTNPPFGAKITDKRILQDFAGPNGVALKQGKMVKSLLQEVAFMQRCLQFLRPKGQLAMVVPDGILANSSLQYVRDWILRWAKLKAVISLPPETFAPYGTAVKTSIILLEKQSQPSRIKDAITNSEENYKVYMAQVDNIGYDAQGHSTGIDETVEVVSDFAAKRASGQVGKWASEQVGK